MLLLRSASAAPLRRRGLHWCAAAQAVSARRKGAMLAAWWHGLHPSHAAAALAAHTGPPPSRAWLQLSRPGLSELKLPCLESLQQAQRQDRGLLKTGEPLRSSGQRRAMGPQALDHFWVALDTAGGGKRCCRGRCRDLGAQLSERQAPLRLVGLSQSPWATLLPRESPLFRPGAQRSAALWPGGWLCFVAVGCDWGLLTVLAVVRFCSRKICCRMDTFPARYLTVLIFLCPQWAAGAAVKRL